MSTSADKAYHHGELRAVLLRSALDLLAESGAEALSLRAVARRAGVSAMAPYRHYPDKEHLLAAVAAYGFAGLRRALLAAEAGVAPHAALAAQASGYVAYAVANPALFRLMFGRPRAGNHPELAAAKDAAYGVLSARVQADTPPGGDTEALVLGCWSMVHGLALLFLDGLIGETTAAPADLIARRVAEAMNWRA